MDRARRSSLFVNFHAPAPPLAWGKPFAGHHVVAPAARGFTVEDTAGLIPITTVELAGPTSVRITVARPPGEAATLRYADRIHGGRGALHDSDPRHPKTITATNPAPAITQRQPAGSRRPALSAEQLVRRLHAADRPVAGLTGFAFCRRVRRSRPCGSSPGSRPSSAWTPRP